MAKNNKSKTRDKSKYDKNKKSKICLNMLIKNENMLTSIIPLFKIINYYIIVTNGDIKLDETIKNMMHKYKIKGEIYGEEQDYKNKSIVSSIGKSDYILFLDSNEELIQNDKLFFKKLDKDCYFIKSNRYKPFIANIKNNNHLGWHWKGASYNYLESTNKNVTYEYINVLRLYIRDNEKKIESNFDKKINSIKMKKNTNAEDVKQFTEESSGIDCPSKPISINKDNVFYIIRMVMSELDELAATVTSNDEECTNFMKDALNNIDKCHNYQYNGDIELIAAQADSMVDAWYYMLNTAAKHGQNLSKLFDIVHEANMNKRDKKTGKFIRRESDGKIIKPDGWTSPDINKEIAKQIEEGSWS
jgi:hypothetical protein